MRKKLILNLVVASLTAGTSATFADDPCADCAKHYGNDPNLLGKPADADASTSNSLWGGTQSTTLQTGTNTTMLQTGTNNTMLRTGTTGMLLQGELNM